MSSLSKASYRALEALKAIQPFLTFTRNQDDPDERRLSRSSGATTLIDSQQDDHYPSGLAKTLRSAASFFYTKDNDDTVDSKHCERYVSGAPRRKNSTASLRGLFRRKSLSQFSQTLEDDKLRPTARADSPPIMQTPTKCASPLPKLNVKIPRSSLRERTGGLTSKSGTNLIDPSEFVLEDSQDDEDDERDHPKSPTYMNVTFDPLISGPILSTNKTSSSDCSTNDLQALEVSPKERRFPLRDRLSIKRSLDRLHARISNVLSPTTRSDPQDYSTKVVALTNHPESSPPGASMGSRDSWDSIRRDRERRYKEAMQDAPSTESDDLTDVDLQLQRMSTNSLLDKKKYLDDSYSGDMDSLFHPEEPLRFAVEANERNCGPVLDNFDFSLVMTGGPCSAPRSHTSSNTTLVDCPKFSSTAIGQCFSSDSEIDDAVRGRPVNRYSSARRSSSPFTPARSSAGASDETKEHFSIAVDKVMPAAAVPQNSLERDLGTLQINEQSLQNEQRDHNVGGVSRVSQTTHVSQDTDAWTTTLSSVETENEDLDSVHDAAKVIRGSTELLGVPNAFDGLVPDFEADFLREWPCGAIHDPSQTQYIGPWKLTEEERFGRSYWLIMWSQRSQLQLFHLQNGLGENLDKWEFVEYSDDLTDTERTALSMFRKFKEARWQAHWWYNRIRFGPLITHVDEDDDEPFGLNHDSNGDQEQGLADQAFYQYGLNSEIRPNNGMGETHYEDAADKDRERGDQTETSPLVTHRLVQDLYDFTRLIEQRRMSSDFSSESSESESDPDWF